MAKSKKPNNYIKQKPISIKNKSLDEAILMHQQSHKITVSKGPLPEPDVLKEYNNIQDGFADRIITMAEKEQNNRHNVLNNVISHEHKEAIVSKVCYVVISLATITGGVIITVTQHPVVGVAVAIAPVIIGFFTFIMGRPRNNDSNLKQDCEVHND